MHLKLFVKGEKKRKTPKITVLNTIRGELICFRLIKFYMYISRSFIADRSNKSNYLHLPSLLVCTLFDKQPTIYFRRMLTVYPQTKIYFAHWPETTLGSAPVLAHGKKVMGGIALAVSKIDDMKAGLLDLSEQHAFKLRVDPSNFRVRHFDFMTYDYARGESDLHTIKNPPVVHSSWPSAFLW